jgi:addiction module RelE/StbE family toxin
MRIDFHKNFIKQYGKLPIKLKEKYDERLEIFKNNPFAPELNNHSLHGEYIGMRSINITGDLRALYKIRDDCNYFIIIDTHSNLYK